MAKLKLKETLETHKEPAPNSDKGDPVKMAVVRPSPKVITDGETVYNTEFWNAYDKKFKVREKVLDIVKEQGIWDDAKEVKLKEIDKQLLDGELKLKAGKKSGLTKLEARKLAIRMRSLRNERGSLISKKNSYDNMTCESKADNARFDYFVSQCALTESGDHYFKNYDDYLKRKDEIAAADAANKLMEMLYGTITDIFRKLPENEFLLKYNYCNDKLQLTDPDKDNRFCDENFRVVDQDGFYLDDKGNRTDLDGNLIDKDGEYIVDGEDYGV